ncbi:hypothetical protein CAL13_01310 [Bordetella genomosp. 9]|uniref:Uncharacterized protein n=1 Tax=Bordetella genomosp. 9 TaxID=1416803 RepID=A0A1W6YV84_9BORD|nr:hypothetical protein CAL13_01310 [Bordetella genomosp. 9]
MTMSPTDSRMSGLYVPAAPPGTTYGAQGLGRAVTAAAQDHAGIPHDSGAEPKGLSAAVVDMVSRLESVPGPRRRRDTAGATPHPQPGASAMQDDETRGKQAGRPTPDQVECVDAADSRYAPATMIERLA